MKDLSVIKSNSSRPSIYRSNSGYGDITISNSRVILKTEDGKVLSPKNSNSDSFETFEQVNQLERGMKSRHVQLLAIGGAIGTGLFVGSGQTLQMGSASLVLAFSIMSVVLYFVMNMLGEMTAFLPLPGNGAQSFVNDYLDPSFGFAMGWNLFYTFSILVGAEVTAAAIVIQYWNKSIHIAVWITIFLFLIIFLNITSVKYFGESEFWFASIKIITLTGLIILGIVLFFGGGPNHDRLGFRYWKNGNAFREHLVEGPTGRFLGVWTAIIKSGFAFICSPELVATAGGECYKPRANIPKAAKRFVYRLVFFYVFGTLVIGVICSPTDPKLLANTGKGNASASPFVLGIQNAGIPVLNHIINAAILTSAASAGNSFLYSSSRVCYSMACKGLAPKIFKKVNRFGVPYFAVGISSLLGFLAYLNVSQGSGQVFSWLSNISTISGFLSWILLSFTYLRWRKAIAFNNLEDRVTFKTPFQPYGAYFVIFMISLLSLTNGYASFIKPFNAANFVAAYITLPVIFILYCSHRIYNRYVNGVIPWLTPLEKVDVLTGLDLIEQEDIDSPSPVAKNWMERVWYWIA